MRLGYVSPNFSAHSVAYFFEPVLAAHDRSAVEVFCYADGRSDDAVRQRLRASAEHWRDIAGQSDAAVADRVRSDGIDVLVDLAGHTAGNRMGVFALAPAAVQVSYLGYPGDTGLPTIDARVTDPIADPFSGCPEGTLSSPSQSVPSGQPLNNRLIRLAGGAWAYRPPDDSPPNQPRPDGPVTFGSFNHLPKLTPAVLRTWAEILTRLPDSRLLLKATGLGSNLGRQHVLEHLAGIDPARIELVGWTKSVAEHLSLYNRLDVALDPFPYNGTTTTCEALWMGVPVVTLSGRRHAARVGASLLTHLGRPDWIALTVPQYIDTAVKTAADTEWRSIARAVMRSSGLLDGRRIAAQLEIAFARMARQAGSEGTPEEPA